MVWPFNRRASVPPETKQSQAGAAIVLTPGQPVWSRRDYEAFAKEAYGKNVVAYQSVQRIADAVASVKWVLFRGETEIDTHPLLDLIARPNPAQSGADYLRAKVTFLLLAGNSYEERIDLRAVPRELYQLRPDRVRVIAGAMGVPAGYEYTGPNGKKVQWDVQPNGASMVRHLKMFHPHDDWYGMSPVEAGSFAVDQHNAAMEWMQALLQNSARPSGALVTKDGATLGDDQFQRLKASIEDHHAGPRNAGRPMLLDGGLDWKPMGLSPLDMGVVEVMNSAARNVALAFGVPPQLIGIPGDSTYANYEQARLAFWEDTVLPLCDMIARDWSASLGDGLEFRPDYDHIPAIADKRKTMWDMADKSTDLTLNERRELKGYDTVAGGDVIPALVTPPPGEGNPDDEGEDVPPPKLTADDVKAIAYGAGLH